MNKINWMFLDKEISIDEIKRLEKIYGVTLPKDYVECAIVNHGGYVDKYSIDIVGNTLAFSNLLSFKEGSCDNIFEIFKSLEGRIVDKVYPFATDPAGNYFCFDYRSSKDNPQIVFYHSELGVGVEDYSDEQLQRIDILSVQNKAIEYVCDSFSELFNKLY